MRFIKSLILGVIAIAITSCVSTGSSGLNLNSKPMVKFRFQNMLGLELYSAGCSMLNEGGVERMCQFAEKNPADFVFQVGPSFTTVFSTIPARDEVQAKRQALWKIWGIQKVNFYSVDALDLHPSLQDFREAHSGSAILLLSSNLKTLDGSYLFQPFLEIEVAGKKIGILSFSEKPKQGIGKDWQLESPINAFKQLEGQLKSRVDIYYVLGAMEKSSRIKISKVSEKPILFLGGALSEKNTVRLVSESARDSFAKTPDLGRGFGELAVGKFEKDFWGKAPQTELGKIQHSFWAYILKDEKVNFNDCSKVLKTTKPQSLPTEALEN